MRSDAVQEVEPDWLNLARSGDTNAFAKLVEQYSVAVYNLCYRMLGDHFEAEDAAQETFMRAYKSLKTYDSKRQFSTWILAIAAHYCIDQLRKKRLKITHLEVNEYQEIADPEPNPETSLAETEQQQRVRALLNTLNDTDRAAVIMFYWYEFSYEEIAHALHLSISAVKSRLHRARTKLAQTWIDKNQSVHGMERQTYGSPAI
jgi:RNA polymerase sigma-70 factor (ECF subfamily)